MPILFMDESGDPGLDVGKAGASELLVFGSVYFHRWDHYHQWRDMHGKWDRITGRVARGPRREFKFSADGDRNRGSFIRAALEIPDWGWCGTVVVKDRLFGWRDGEDWYRTAAGYHRNIVTYNHAYDHARGRPHGTIVRIDQRHMTKKRRQALEQEVLARHNAGIINPPKWVTGVFQDPRFLDSTRSAGVQLADYVAGACQAALRSRKRTAEWLNYLLRNRNGYCQVWPKR